MNDDDDDDSALTGPMAYVMFLIQQTLAQNTLSFSLRQITTQEY